jgi:hypothetical protein
MKQTKKVKSFLQRECKRYCKQISLKEPTLIFTDKDLRETVYGTREFKDAKQYTLGLSWFNQNTVYLNLSNTDFIPQLIDTLIHELVHLKWPKANHNSDAFRNKINGITMGDRY